MGNYRGEGNEILNLTDWSENPVGDWNRMKIECLKDEVKVWCNGELVNHGHGCTAQKGQAINPGRGVRSRVS